MGTTPPPELEQFLIEQAFWKELGWTSKVAVEDRPWKQAEDYALFISMIRREEAARQAQANRRR